MRYIYLPFILLLIWSCDKSTMVETRYEIYEQVEEAYGVDNQLENMQMGSIAYNAPSKINIDDSPMIQLLLSLTETISELQDTITQQGELVGETIKVTDRMEALLKSNDFNIIEKTPRIQAISESMQTEWLWEIHPMKKGKYNLHLTINAYFDVNGHDTPRKIKTYDRTIFVEVTIKQNIIRFIGNNWKWLWAAIVVPIVGWLWKRKKKKK